MRIVEVRDFASEDLKTMFEEARNVFDRVSKPDAVIFTCTYPLYKGLEIEISISDFKDYTKISPSDEPDLKAQDEYVTLFLTKKICW